MDNLCREEIEHLNMISKEKGVLPPSPTIKKPKINAGLMIGKQASYGLKASMGCIKTDSVSRFLNSTQK